MRAHARGALWRMWAAVILAGSPGLVAAQTGPGPFARLVLLEPRPGMAAQFEAGYRRHLDWHRAHQDPWAWYGWSVVFGEQVGWFMDGTFGRSAGSLDSAVAPGADAEDAAANVAPYAEFRANAIYEFLPDVSTGSAAPPATPWLELTTYDLAPGPEAGAAFERALGARDGGTGGCRWYRLVAGGPVPRYICLRPVDGLAAVAAPAAARAPRAALPGVARVTVAVLVFRPELSAGVPPATETTR